MNSYILDAVSFLLAFVAAFSFTVAFRLRGDRE